jgi:hypothetical protein
MSKVRTSGKARKAKSTASMMDDENEIVNALAKTLDLFTGNGMADNNTTETISNTQLRKKNNSDDGNGMGENIDEKIEKNEEKSGEKKEKKKKVNEIIVEAPRASELASLLPKMVKMERKVVGLNKEGISMTKIRSKKDRIKDKQQALMDHIASTHEVVSLHTKKDHKNEKKNVFSFSDDFSKALEDSTNSANNKNVGHNPLTNILNGAPAWKNDKKNNKMISQDKNKFEEVIQHPAFQADSIGALKQHLTNQMAMMKQIDDNENQSKKNISKKIQKKQQGGQDKYDKLVKNNKTLASSMKK